MVARNHLPYQILEKGDSVLLYKIVCVRCSKAMLKALMIMRERKRIWRGVEAELSYFILMLHVAKEKARL